MGLPGGEHKVLQEENDPAEWQFVLDRDFQTEVEHYFRSKEDYMQ